MFQDIINLLVNLVKTMSVVMVLAYVMTRTGLYHTILDKKVTRVDQLQLIFIFGFFSIFGTLGGINILGAIANIRDLGPAIGGLVAGPVVGIGAGLIGAAHRLALGGFTAVACSISTVLAGLAAGLLYRYNKGEFIGLRAAVAFAALVEVFHMGVVLLSSRPFSQALALVQQISFPMIFANALGMGIFSFILVNYIRERETAAAKEMMEGELKVAREIQMGIIPKMFPPFPDQSEFDLYAILEPAKEVGGDLYDFFLLDDEYLFFAVGDVSGKGVPASLFMAVTKTLLKARAITGMTPGEILHRVNNELCMDNDSSMFVTVFLGILHLCRGEITYSNGGHNLPYLYHRDGRLQQLEKTPGIALGVMEDIPYGNREVVLQEGDCLLLYSDGVTEAHDLDNNLYEEERLEGFLAREGGSPPRELCQKLQAEINDFARGREPADDITVMAIKFYGCEKKCN